MQCRSSMPFFIGVLKLNGYVTEFADEQTFYIQQHDPTALQKLCEVYHGICC